ncbi:MAG TPA: alpha/beta fold hydrolase [Xanthomonadaceae bacterium]|nr:alpha/beta fold hydrolase [Xanthomonadaceae bacterium]
MNPQRFQPAFGLGNSHLQSLLASSRVRRWFCTGAIGRLERASRELVLDCGNGVRLLGLHTPRTDARGLVVLLHGWEGSAGSTYLVRLAARLHSDGYEVFRLNFRDHGPTHHLNEELFHSNRIDEVVGAVAAIACALPARPLLLCGYSLGGNFALRVALRAAQIPAPIAHVVAVCPVVSPANGLQALERARWYERYFMHKWRGSLRRKQRLYPGRYDFDDWQFGLGLRGLTRLLVERYTDFGTLERYLDGYSIGGDRLAALAVPASILTAADDPIIPVSDFHALRTAPGTRLDIAPHGGHCGFIGNWRLDSFAEDYVLAQLGTAAPAAAAGPSPGARATIAAPAES